MYETLVHEIGWYRQLNRLRRIVKFVGDNHEFGLKTPIK